MPTLAVPKPIRVALIDASPLSLKVFERAVLADSAFELAGSATNGRAGLALIESARPDVVCCSTALALVGSVELVAQIMSRNATPILVIQARGANEITNEETTAMLQAGAIDWVAKPESGPRSSAQIDEFLLKLARTSRVKVLTRRLQTPELDGPRAPISRAATEQPRGVAASGRALAGASAGAPEIIAIGASTGGPPVLLELLRALDPGAAAPVLCVQHIAHGFLDEMLDWLRAQCRVEITVARGGEIVRGGTVYFPAQDRHLEISCGGRLALSAAPPRAGHRPAVDALFESVARSYGARALAILLSGMGADGALGLQQIQARGGATWAQSPASCVVAGMPGRAIELGAANEVLTPGEMARRIGEF